ncbi:polyunsaturated fatty acid 5-lipoxygenase-like [Glandiceps talaboti]
MGSGGSHHQLRYISIRTGELQGAGTNSSVHLIFFNENDDKSEVVTPNKTLHNDFKRGDIDTYPVKIPANFGPVTKTEVWCDTWLGDKWYVDYLKVAGKKGKDVCAFPMQRWIDSKHFVVYRNDSCLPQFAPNAEERRRELDRKKVLYQFATPTDGLPSTVINLPKSDEFTVPYESERLMVGVKGELSKMLISLISCEWKSLGDIKNIYGGSLKMPINPDVWKEEWYFGAQRLMGCNPIQIKLCSDIPDKFAVEDSKIQPLMENLSLNEAISQKRLFIVDHEDLEDLPQAKPETVVCAPIALFFRTKENTLIPVAIQLFQQKREDNPVFMPSDPKYTWLVAKLFFNNADAQDHEAISHLLYTHLVMESFALAAHRQLSQSHPMFRLMAAHFQFLLAINSGGLPILMDPGGWFDDITSIGRDGALELMRRKWKNWRLDVQGTLPNELKHRGVDDPNVLPNYYYRDDALLTYNAINAYVSKIVNAHYDDSEKLNGDFELQSWGEELAAPQPQGFGIQGMPGNGHFSTTDDVIQVITCVIFTSSVTHGAVNFNQYDQYADPLKSPMYLRGIPPKNKTPLTEKDVLAYLPDKSTQLKIMVMAQSLSLFGTEKLGYFDKLYQSDSISQSAIKEFQEDLKKVGETIDERNKKRIVSYQYLHPSVLPNAISI